MGLQIDAMKEIEELRANFNGEFAAAEPVSEADSRNLADRSCRDSDHTKFGGVGRRIASKRIFAE